MNEWCSGSAFGMNSVWFGSNLAKGVVKTFGLKL